MRKFTLFLMSLFLSVGAMAQTTQKVEINLTTIAGQPGYVSSPHDHAVINPNSQSDKGGVAALIDGDPNTHFHTAWENVPDGPHYFQVDLGEENTIGDFSFNYVSRKEARSDFPSQFTIKGSTNGNDFELIKVINIDMPSTPEAATGESYSFDVTGVTKEYRYLRFEVTNTKSYDNAGYRIYFHAAEFDLFKIVTEETERADYVHNTGSMNRKLGEERGLTTFTLTDGTNSLEVSNIQDVNSRTAPVYVDKSSVKFTTTQGATLSFSAFSYTGSWMHAYAYVDYNNDYKFILENNNNGEGEGEIVSYNYYDGNDITGATASQSDAMSSEHNGSKTLPAFTLPANLAPGEYRMRIKIDWNNLDADYGASDIAANGGCQCDITLVVEESAANSEAKAELKDAIEELDAFLANISVGNCITQYSSSIDSPDTQIEGIRNFYEAITSETTIESIEEKTANVRAIKESYKENVLEDGKFYHIHSVVYENGYVYASVTDKKPSDDRNERNGICWEATTTPSNAAIWKCEIIDGVTYFKSVYTASYMNGLLQYCPGILSETEKAPVILTALGDGQVNFLVNGEPAHAQTGNNELFFVPWEGGKDSPSAWYVEEAKAGVQPHTLTVGPAGYATLMLGYNTTIPTIEGEDNGVFTAKVEGEYAVLNEINGVLPANTAVIIKAAPGTYNFDYATGEATAIENNDLRGTLYDKNITDAAYVLGIVDDVVGLYTAAYNVSTDKTNDGTEEAPMVTYEAWKNNAFKAYLPKTAGMNAASYSFRFGEGTTGINEVKGENGEVKAIFDLTGRRVEAITAPGIYIVNGKKVLVK